MHGAKPLLKKEVGVWDSFIFYLKKHWRLSGLVLKLSKSKVNYSFTAVVHFHSRKHRRQTTSIEEVQNQPTLWEKNEKRGLLGAKQETLSGTAAGHI